MQALLEFIIEQRVYQTMSRNKILAVKFSGDDIDSKVGFCICCAAWIASMPCMLVRFVRDGQQGWSQCRYQFSALQKGTQPICVQEFVHIMRCFISLFFVLVITLILFFVNFYLFSLACLSVCVCERERERNRRERREKQKREKRETKSNSIQRSVSLSLHHRLS